MTAIELDSLRKQFDDIVALRDVDLTVQSGEVFGLLGPNGAGKSTMIDVVLDYVRPTAGTATVFGLDAQQQTKAVHRRVGVLPDAYHLDGHLSARTHVEFAIESMDADDDSDALLDRVGLGSVTDRLVRGFSKGMEQRLALALALVGEPELLILDEPSTGLDPNGARRMRTIIHEECDRGATVFFSSHILGQVQAVCDRVGILVDGTVVAVDSIGGLQETVGTAETLRITLDSQPGETIESVRQLPDVRNVSVSDGVVSVSCPARQKVAVIDTLRQNATVLDIETREVSLDELFATYTGADG
ncbi:ABC transporter ATP-binding protein [Halocatena pleomorpha]|uniref:ABC transporter ATP-binding protein n=1 Tax=Halocatena pleomorpha TaxID=1785090 RepID=A0A3P3RKW6_9EURY|nr:ABC transporter ATP-binding protein [Halocatena pleomorpha]RRJ33500.1 ABC transporter ATP-binding protein [Halocatena pleomorpha]